MEREKGGKAMFEPLTDEDVRKAIEDTIAFEEKMQDPEFLREMAIQEEKLKSVDLRPEFMRRTN